MTDLVPINQAQSMSVMELGSVLQRSGYFQDVTQASQAVVKILAGQELGIGPIAAMTGIYILALTPLVAATVIGVFDWVASRRRRRAERHSSAC